ncbi:MAG: terminase TerL endonuclease subunit [candidate division WOR-3 bacterium]
MKKALKYLNAVLKGDVVVCEWIKKVVLRHFSDIERTKDPKYPYLFLESKAEKAIDLFERQRLALGASSGKPFVLMDWQAAIVSLLFGWREKETGLRRFKKVYIKVARGNAKTEFLAGIGNMMFLFEGAQDPQVFWAATKRDQAKIGFMRQRRMLELLVNDYPALKKRVKFTASKILERGGMGFVMALGKDSRTEDGFSPYCALIDEFHAHPSTEMLNVLESGMVKHACPLVCIITTAGFNPDSPCARFEEMCKRVLDGHVDIPFLLPFIYDLDAGDDWRDKNVWIKANPSLGHTLTIEALNVEFMKALSEGVVKQEDFKRKNLNVWISSYSSWLPDDVFWASAKPFDENELIGRVCFGGLDLSRSRDLTALVLLFPPINDEKEFKVITRFWCPRENARFREKNDGIPYLQWAEEGWIRLTEGDVIDTDFIYNEIFELYNKFKIHSIAFDRWRAIQMVTKLNDEIGPVPHTQTGNFMEPFSQTTTHFHVPMTELEKVVLSGQLNHGKNPVLRWMSRNVSLYVDGNGNMKIDRKKSSDKVDGMVALSMAFGQYITYAGLAKDYYSPDVDVFVL